MDGSVLDLKAISDVGDERWAPTASDSTNVTKAARRDITAKIPTILDLRDSVHHIQLTIKDITNLEEFKPVCAFSVPTNPSLIRWCPSSFNY
jgi:hypothetical protein